MNDSLYGLGAVVLVTSLMWLPYVLNMILVQGLMGAMGYRDDLPPLSDWAMRAKKAHFNAIENLAIFAPLVLALALIGERTGLVATLVTLYLAFRVLHYLVYTFRIPVLRTFTFFGGWGVTVYLAIILLDKSA
ncbi:MAG: MAPEG family protein [Myxococcota bacterium]